MQFGKLPSARTLEVRFQGNFTKSVLNTPSSRTLLVQFQGNFTKVYETRPRPRTLLVQFQGNFTKGVPNAPPPRTLFVQFQGNFTKRVPNEPPPRTLFVHFQGNSTKHVLRTPSCRTLLVQVSYKWGSCAKNVQHVLSVSMYFFTCYFVYFGWRSCKTRPGHKHTRKQHPGAAGLGAATSPSCDGTGAQRPLQPTGGGGGGLGGGWAGVASGVVDALAAFAYLQEGRAQ